MGRPLQVSDGEYFALGVLLFVVVFLIVGALL